jgi:hypothetical protein
MRVLPESGVEWTDVVLAPFKVYTLVMFLVAVFWGRAMARGDEAMILYILLGQIVCVIVLTWTAMVDTFCIKSATTNWRWSGIALLGFLFALKALL